MFEKVKNLLKEQNYSVPKLLISNYKKFNVTDDELILLIFILNSNLEFNPKDLAEKMALSKADIFNKINSLEEKGLLKIKSIALKGIRSEVLDLEEMYSKLAFLVVNAEEKTKETTVFSSFEKEYARTLSPTEYELINEWLKIYSEEMINLALKEAVYNGVSNLKYIDKILYNWGKKGLTTKEKIENDSVKYKNKKSDVNIVDYDWLGVKN